MGQAPKTLCATLPIMQLESLPLISTLPVCNACFLTTLMTSSFPESSPQSHRRHYTTWLNNWSLSVQPVPHQLNICVNHHLPLSGSCCPCPLQTAGLGSPRAPPAQAPGPAPDWLCCCPCYEVSGEAISSTGDCTASRPLPYPHLLPAPARMRRRPLGRQKKSVSNKRKHQCVQIR